VTAAEGLVAEAAAVVAWTYSVLAEAGYRSVAHDLLDRHSAEMQQQP